MINLEDYSIYVYRDRVDFRKSIDGLSAIVANEMQLEIHQKSLFLFRNQRRDKIKVLYWDISGFALWYKRLEKSKFPWPKDHEDQVVYISHKQLNWLLKGVDYWSLKPHENLLLK